MNLEGKAGIVTGAGRGIGRAIALLMAKEGASVIVNDLGAGREGQATADRSADQVVQEIKAAGGKAIANFDSVSDYASAGRMVRQCADTWGKIDFVVNTAGMLRERMIWNMTEEDFDAVISVPHAQTPVLVRTSSHFAASSRAKWRFAVLCVRRPRRRIELSNRRKS